MSAQKESRSVALYIRNFGGRWGCVVIATPRPLTPEGTILSYCITYEIYDTAIKLNIEYLNVCVGENGCYRILFHPRELFGIASP